MLQLPNLVLPLGDLFKISSRNKFCRWWEGSLVVWANWTLRLQEKVGLASIRLGQTFTNRLDFQGYCLSTSWFHSMAKLVPLLASPVSNGNRHVDAYLNRGSLFQVGQPICIISYKRSRLILWYCTVLYAYADAHAYTIHMVRASLPTR
jgi:hypothetical protein